MVVYNSDMDEKLGKSVHQVGRIFISRKTGHVESISNTMYPVASAAVKRPIRALLDMIRILTDLPLYYPKRCYYVDPYFQDNFLFQRESGERPTKCKRMRKKSQRLYIHKSIYLYIYIYIYIYIIYI